MLNDGFNLNLHQNEVLAMIVLPVIVFSWIRDLDQLSYYSMMANVALLFSLIVIFYDEIFRLITPDPAYTAKIRTDRLPAIKGVVSVATFLGGAVYAFEGIGVVSSETRGSKQLH